MRPIKITMNAFGPYSSKTVVDLGLLGGRGLYLITGDTGAGKTTIFDAVCYALFGKASGDLRKADMFRSQYADESEVTYVEMVFEYGGKRYRVYREPKQISLKKRGEGYRERNAVGEVYNDETGELLAAGETQVTSAIKEIIGLDLDQYRNIAMIAQGSFAQLLTASTADRTRILSAIFSTGNYSELQRRIVADHAKTKNAYDDSQLRIRTLLGAMKLSENDPSREYIEQAAQREVQTDCEELINVCSEAAEFENENLKQRDESYKKADSALKKAITELDSAKKLNDLFIRKQDAQKRFDETELKLSQAKKLFEEQKKNKPEIDKLVDRLAAEKDRLKDYDAAEKLMNEAADISKQAEKAKKEQETLSLQEKACKTGIEKAKAVLNGLDDIKAELVKCENESKTLGEKLGEIKTLGTELRNVIECEKMYHEEAKALKERSAEFEKADKAYHSAYISYIEDQAGILAGSLKEGEKCPVCGSRTHPEPAKMQNGTVDKKTVDDLSNVLEIRRSALSRQSEVCGKLNERLTVLTSAAKEKAEKHLGCNDISQAIEQARVEFKRVNSKLEKSRALYSELCEKQKQKDSTQKRLEEEENKLNDIVQKQQAASSQAIKLSAAAQEKSNSAKAQLEKLPFKSKSEAVANIAVIEGRRDVLQKALLNAEKDVQSLVAKSGEIKGALDLLELQTKGKQQPDLAKLEETHKALAAETKAAMALRDEANSCLTACRDTVKKLTSEVKIQSGLAHELSIKTPIYRTAIGQVKDKDKVQLETYAQLEYFNKILAHANVRLLQMTNGQYELLRSLDKKGNTKTGLDLDVMDHFSAKVRSISSLSGGESFMASLALALGFSDEIQQSSGGIRIDSMFVDEGFGSLDEDVLDQAVKVLTDLAENSRLIGIISHINELKDKIGRQIVVKKDRAKGSSVEIIC